MVVMGNWPVMPLSVVVSDVRPVVPLTGGYMSPASGAVDCLGYECSACERPAPVTGGALTIVPPLSMLQ